MGLSIKMGIIATMLLFCAAIAFAGDRTHNYYPPAQIDTYVQMVEPTDPSKTDGVALGIAAAQHQFDFGTHKWQWSAGVGYYDDNSAASVGFAKRIDRVLIDATIGREGNKTGGGVGLHGRFE